jgi:tyrosine-protein phosphatase SIW14
MSAALLPTTTTPDTNEDDEMSSEPRTLVTSGGAIDSSDTPRPLFSNPFNLALQIPPLNFAMVMPGVYRSGYFNSRNYGFMESCLQLRSVINLADDYSKHKIGLENVQWARSRSVSLFTLKLDAFKEPFGYTDESIVVRALSIILDTRNHPILVHDEKGKHRAGVLVGCLRKLQGYSLASIFHEYASFTHGSWRLLDMQYIELFNHPIPCVPDCLPLWLETDRGNGQDKS